jgi:hypothetical protein
MAWAKVDDGFWCHPKVMGLPLAPRGLWVSALSWSCAHRQATVPHAFLDMALSSTADAEALVAAGLWIADEDGWRIHDWSEYQEWTTSEKRAQAGRKGGQRSGEARRSKQKLTEVLTCGDLEANRSTGEATAEAGPSLPIPTLPNPTTKSQDYLQPEAETASAEVAIGSEVVDEQDPPAAPAVAGPESKREPWPIPEPDPDPQPVGDQGIRRTAKLVGEAVAASKGAGAGYAAVTTKRILAGTAASDQAERRLIEDRLAAGETPEAIAESWAPPPLDVLGRPIRPLVAPHDPVAAEAGRQAAYTREAETHTRLREALDEPRGDDMAGLRTARGVLRSGGPRSGHG